MRFFAQLNKGSIQTDADRMEVDKDNNMLYVHDGEKLVAVLDLGTVIFAHFHD